MQKVLAEKEISAQPRAWILSGSAGEHYVEKGGQIELYFEIADNVEAPLSKLVVHHTELAAEPWQEGVWKVTLPAPEESGEQKLTLSQLVFADGVRVDISHDVLVEVMKSAPEVQGYAAEDILEKDQVKFQFVLSDADGAFLSGKIQLISNDGAAVVAQEAIIQPGRQEFTLDVEEQKEYTSRVLATWKQTEDGSRQSVDDVLLEKTVYMVRDYGLRLSEISTSSPEGVNTVYFEPGSRVKIRFRAQTNTSLAVERAQINGKLFDLAPLAGDVYELTATIGSQPGVRTVTIDETGDGKRKRTPVTKRELGPG